MVAVCVIMGGNLLPLMKQIRNPKSSEPLINADFTDYLRSASCSVMPGSVPGQRLPARGNVCCPDMVPELILACEPGKEAIQIGIS